jgi:hypothetical protein
MSMIVRCAAASALVLVLAACSGGDHPSFTGRPPTLPNPTAAPTAVPFVPDSTARAAAQGALLAQQAAAIVIAPAGGPSIMTARRAAAVRSTRSNVTCSSGYSEQDTPGSQSTHAAISLYYDAQCSALRQTQALDSAFGVDTGNVTGTIASYDAAGHVTATQALGEFFFASGGGFVTRKTTDAAGTSTTPFAQTTLFCALSGPQCTVAAVVNGPSFSTGAVLSANVPVQRVPPGSSVTIPFTGSLSTATTPGAIAIVQAPLAAPTLSGGTPLGTIAGNLTITPAAAGPAAFSLTLDAGSLHAVASLANGTTTLTITGATTATATVNANGDGTIRYASGATENILDFRIAG